MCLKFISLFKALISFEICKHGRNLYKNKIEYEDKKEFDVYIRTTLRGCIWILSFMSEIPRS